MLNIKTVEVKVTPTKGEPKVIPLIQTQEPTKNKAGKLTKAIYQPAKDGLLLSFGKVYIDTEAKS